MLTFTLDTNCIIDIEEGRHNAVYIKKLIEAHQSGSADVAYVAQSASENQKGGIQAPNYEVFKAKIESAGMSCLRELLSLLYWDVSFWDRGLWASDEALKREKEIHSVLFPNAQFNAPTSDDACDLSTKELRVWINQKCDVLCYWAHDFNSRDVFVTSDTRFERLETSSLFPKARVLGPLGAAALV